MGWMGCGDSILQPIHWWMRGFWTWAQGSNSDTIIENAEVTGYTMLIQMAIKQNIGDAIFSFIKTKSPRGRKEMFGWL